MEQFILPIISGDTIAGQGFIADGFLITAAHVVWEHPNCFTVINGTKFELSANSLSQKYIGEGDINHDPTLIDLAMFKCNLIDSPLHLSEYTFHKDETLLNYCKHEVTDTSRLNPTYKLEKVTAIITGEEEGNYFYCTCKQYPGSSGSPLLKGNLVIGIMHGGDCNELCAFLKADVALKLL